MGSFSKLILIHLRLFYLEINVKIDIHATFNYRFCVFLISQRSVSIYCTFYVQVPVITEMSTLLFDQLMIIGKIWSN